MVELNKRNYLGVHTIGDRGQSIDPRRMGDQRCSRASARYVGVVHALKRNQQGITSEVYRAGEQTSLESTD